MMIVLYTVYNTTASNLRLLDSCNILFILSKYYCKQVALIYIVISEYE